MPDIPGVKKGRAQFLVDGFEFGEAALENRPQHAAVLGRIFTSWSFIEACIASLLGIMMHADHRAAMAILETFRTNSSRVNAVRKVGKSMLAPDLQSDFDALMKEVLAYADERNKIAHSLWGASASEPQFVYRLSMSVVPAFMADTRMPDISSINKMIADFRGQVTPFSVEDLLQIERRGAEVLRKVMTENVEKRFQRTVQLYTGGPA